MRAGFGGGISASALSFVVALAVLAPQGAAAPAPTVEVFGQPEASRIVEQVCKEFPVQTTYSDADHALTVRIEVHGGPAFPVCSFSLLFVDGRDYLFGWSFGGMPVALQGRRALCLLDFRDYTCKLCATAGPGARTIRVSRGLAYEDKNVAGDEGSTPLEIDLRPYLLWREAPERVVRVGTKDRFTLILTGQQDGKGRQAQVTFDRASAFPIRRVVASVEGEGEITITFATSVKTFVPPGRTFRSSGSAASGFPSPRSRRKPRAARC